MTAYRTVIQKIEISLSTSSFIPIFLPYFSWASLHSPLSCLSLFVLCLRVSCSCYVLLAVYSWYCFAVGGFSSRGAVRSGKFSDLRENCRTVDGEYYLCILGSQPGGGVRSSGTPWHCQLIQAELSSNAYPRLHGTSESHRQFDFIRAELPSNGYPQPSGGQPASALFKPLRRIWADRMRPPRTAFTHYGFRSRQESSPARRAPLLCLSLFSAASFSSLVSLRMRVRRWTP